MRAPEGIRTPNLLIRSQVLYPLSYGRSGSAVFPSYWVRIRGSSRSGPVLLQVSAPDLIIRSQVLYPLSYGRVPRCAAE